MARNFGMPRPEGYRKALRLMELAERFQRPLLTFIDTPGAYPGVGAEERGQAEAIARNLRKWPAEGADHLHGDGRGRLRRRAGDRRRRPHPDAGNSIYSVISPEGCASILWKSADKAKDAAEPLGITASAPVARPVDKVCANHRRRAPQPAPDGGAPEGGPAQRTGCAGATVTQCAC